METTPQRSRPGSSISRALNAIDLAGPETSVTPGPLEVREIQNAAELDEVYRLTHDAYLERGYCTAQPDGKLIHYPHLDNIPQTTILVAIENGRIVGTNSFTLDGPQGLHVDKDFKSECDAIRAEGRALGASWRIATHKHLHGETRVVMALIEETLKCMLHHDVATAVFTFNPRHERIYKKLLNMDTVARSENTNGLNSAPAVFMRLDAERIPERWLAPVVQSVGA